MSHALNFRHIFFCFIAFAIGIGFANYLFNLNFLILLLTFLAFAALLVYCLKFKQIIIFLCMFLAFVLGLGAFFVDSSNFKGNSYNGENVQIAGRISDNLVCQNGQAFFTLSRAVIDGKSDRDISIVASGDTSKVKVGYYIEFQTDIYNYELFPNQKFNYFAYKDGTPYFAEVQIANMKFKGGEMTLAEKFKENAQQVLNDFMSPNGAAFGFSVLFGDKKSLNDEMRDDFNITGTAHILAVSGLHVGILVGLLFWFFKRLNFNKLLQFLLITIFLAIYAYLCNFTASVVRASLMCLVFLASGVFGRRYDLLNSVGIAGLCILIFAPLMVFDVGFQLSFVCALAIAFFYKPLTEFINRKICRSQYLSGAIAIELITTLAVFPLMVIYFGQLSAFTLLANLIAIPIFAVGFSLLFAFTPIVLLFSFLGFILFLPDLFLRLIVTIVDFFASLEFAVISFKGIEFLALACFYVIMFMLSRYVMLSTKKRMMYVSVAVMICFLFTASFAAPLTPKSNQITQLNSISTAVVVTSEKGESLVVTETSSLATVGDYLVANRMGKVDYFVLLNSSVNAIQKENINKFIFKYNVKNLIIFKNSYSYQNDFKNINVIFATKTETENKLINNFSSKNLGTNIIKKEIVAVGESLLANKIFASDFNSVDSVANEHLQTLAQENEVEIYSAKAGHANIRWLCLNENYKAVIIETAGEKFLIGTSRLGSVQQSTVQKYLQNENFTGVFAKRETFGFFEVAKSQFKISQYKFNNLNEGAQLSNLHSLYLQGNFTFRF